MPLAYLYLLTTAFFLAMYAIWYHLRLKAFAWFRIIEMNIL